MHEPTIHYYEVNARRFFEETRSLDMRPLYEPFLSLLRPNAHVLDAGCGPGRDSLFFLENGYRVTAFDASEAMVSLASRHLGQPVLRLSFDELEEEKRFDAVWACASLLHVPRRTMADVLGHLGRSLKDGGVMYASFKYGDGETFRDGRLFNDYNERGFRRLLSSRPELRIIKLWQTADLRPGRADEAWFNALLRRV